MRPSRVPPRLSTALGAIGIGALAAALLVGCTPTPAPSDSPGRTRSPSATPSTTPTPRPEPTPTGGSAAVALGCPDLVDAQTLYDFNPIYSPRSPVQPAPGTAAAQTLADGGRVCEWINTTSGSVIDLSLEAYDAATLSSMRARLDSTATSGTDWGADASWFSSSGGAGVSTALVGSVLITLRGVEFSQPRDADAFMTSAVSAARSAG